MTAPREQRAPVDLRVLERQAEAVWPRWDDDDVLTLIDCLRLARKALQDAMFALAGSAGSEEPATDADVTNATAALRELDECVADGEGAK